MGLQSQIQSLLMGRDKSVTQRATPSVVKAHAKRVPYSTLLGSPNKQKWSYYRSATDGVLSFSDPERGCSSERRSYPRLEKD